MMSLFTTLLLAHLLGDFPFQTNYIYALKLKGGYYILPHVLIHVLITAVLIGNLTTSWPLLIILGIIHFSIDWFKVNKPLSTPDIDFIIDQAMHIASLIFLAYAMPHITPLLPLTITFWGAILAFIPALMMFSWVYALTQKEKEPVILWMQDTMCLLSQRTGQVIVLGLFLISVVILT